MEQFELALGDGFPLNLSACRVAFPPADWPAQDVLTLVVGGRQLGKSSLLLALQRRFTGLKGIDCRYLSVGQAGIESRLAAALGLPTATPLPDLLRQLAQAPSGTRRVLLLDEADAFVAEDAARGYACLNLKQLVPAAGRS
ncbi:hypothetical protein [uncultured Thiodictyon sp.]|uniref:hypothetical protein n=1 Tax=uncultured Thiodictyon sp. TaxID=1846217 RepID=UPI0025D9F0D8|nr:hypothetical protein [uncultured Thiodictyon sp.]